MPGAFIVHPPGPGVVGVGVDEPGQKRPVGTGSESGVPEPTQSSFAYAATLTVKLALSGGRRLNVRPHRGGTLVLQVIPFKKLSLQVLEVCVSIAAPPESLSETW